MADWEREMDTCSHCGQPRSMCGDPTREWFSQRVICYPERERLVAQRRFDELHKDHPFHDGTHASWVAEFSPSHPFRYDDGVHIFTASVDADPGDDFLTNKNAVPSTPPTKGEEVASGTAPRERQDRP